MKAALYEGEHSIKMTTQPIPECGPNDVLIKNLRAGICGSDVAVYEHGLASGHKIKLDHPFGHEMISVVAAVGKNVTDFKVGQRVYPYPLLASGDPSNAGSLGGFSEYLLVPDARLNRELYLVPDSISNRTGALIEPFTVGTHAAYQAHPQPGENAIVYGAGTIGIAAATALRHAGCQKIMLVDLSDYRLSIARQMGFATCNSSKTDLETASTEFFGLAPSLNGQVPAIDITIDAVGAAEIFDRFMAKGPIDSRYVIVGVAKQARQVDLLSLTYSSRAIIGSGGYRPKDVQIVLDIMQKENDLIEKMVTHEFAWKDLEQGIQTAADPQHALNVQIVYQD